MILCVLYHLMPDRLHDLMFSRCGKVIMQLSCRTCGRVWYGLGNPAFCNTAMTTRGNAMILKVPKDEKVQDKPVDKEM